MIHVRNVSPLIVPSLPAVAFNDRALFSVGEKGELTVTSCRIAVIGRDGYISWVL